MSAARPHVVAHRAGNDLELLRRAEAAGAWLVEADVHLYRGRLEVRHLKAAGPLLWDLWYVAPRGALQLELPALLAAAGAPLMLDLKGRDRRLPRRLAAELQRVPPRVPVTVCSRSWRLLVPLRELPEVRVVDSVGSRRQLRALRRRFAGHRLAGISIHRRLLDAATVADLRARAELLLTWPVASAEDARRLADWGVDGVITQRFEALAA
jgi:glycerophosphoryl diester phosphodiesterase